jgi:hypothetical protein
MLSEPLQRSDRVSRIQVFQKIYGMLLLMELLFHSVELIFGHRSTKITEDCYKNISNEALFCICRIIIFIGYFFVDKRNIDDNPCKIGLVMIVPQCFQIIAGVWAIIIQYTISDSCKRFWASDEPIIWIGGMYVNVWILWFILGMDSIYLLNRRYDA